jgi:hypothetical protein
MSEMPLESPPEDVREQRTDAYADRPSRGSDVPFEADPADALDQADEVPLDDDGYR